MAEVPEPEVPEPDVPSEAEPEVAETPVAPQLRLKRWMFVLMLVAVWIPAGAIGLGLFHWWFHALEKSWPVFVVLVLVVVCTVVGLLAAMVDGRPLVAAAAIAILSAPFAATAAAAPLYGVNYCQTLQKIDSTSRCLIGMIPY